MIRATMTMVMMMPLRDFFLGFVGDEPTVLGVLGAAATGCGGAIGVCERDGACGAAAGRDGAGADAGRDGAAAG